MPAVWGAAPDAMNLYYMLDADRVPVPCDLATWLGWMETADRTVKKTNLGDVIDVSTVFLGLNHNFGGVGLPLLFETMVFRYPSREGRLCAQYPTWAAAVAGHAEVVRHLRAEERVDVGL